MHAAFVPEGGRRRVGAARRWLSWSKPVGGGGRQIHLPITPRGDGVAVRPELAEPTLPRKASQGVACATVPETDTGGLGEHPKARGLSLVKELDKLAP